MKLDVKAMALAGGLLWGGGMLIVTLCNLAWPTYGAAFLQVMASVYSGYTGEPTMGQVLVGTGYALVDGVVGFALLAWLYNRFARS